MVYTYTYDQLRPGEEMALKRFTSLISLEKMGLSVDLDEYYTVDNGTIEARNPVEGCEKLYERYNVYFPDDYTGRSMSVSDVVNLWDNAQEPPKKTSWYCDAIGFKQLD